MWSGLAYYKYFKMQIISYSIFVLLAASSLVNADFTKVSAKVVDGYSTRAPQSKDAAVATDFFRWQGKSHLYKAIFSRRT